MLNEILLTQFNQSQYPLFEQESFCIPELYYQSLPKFDSGKTRKCHIFLTGEHIPFQARKVVGISENIQIFNFKKYFGQNALAKKTMQLEAVHKGMLEIAAENGWHRKPFETAYQTCFHSDLTFRKEIKKRKRSPNRKYFLSLTAYCDLNTFQLEWTISDKNGNVMQQNTLPEDAPSSLDIIYLIDFHWINDKHFVVEKNYKGLITDTWDVFPTIPISA